VGDSGDDEEFSGEGFDVKKNILPAEDGGVVDYGERHCIVLLPITLTTTFVVLVTVP
jgi:hypothetical protein